MNNVTLSGGYGWVVAQAFVYALLALVYTAQCWKRVTRAKRIPLALFALLDLQTLLDVVVRRLPALLGW